MKIQIVFFCVVSMTLFYCCKDSTTKYKDTPSTDHSQSKQDTTTVMEMDYLALGKNIATETQAVLAKNLMGSISIGGTTFALEFCNSKAIVLTDSMAKVLHTGIKRVSDNPRNAGNQSNEMELAHIQLLKDKLSKGEVPEAKMQEVNSKMIGYYPIITNTMCLQCHGKKEVDIKTVTLQKIQKLYPSDKATGYGLNELRGLWVVEMDKK